MPSATDLENLRGLVLSATEVSQLNPNWSQAMVEDYLNIFDNLVTLSNIIEVSINAKIEEIPTDFTDGSIPFAKDQLLTEENSRLFWDTVNKILKITGIIQSSGRIKGTVYVTPAMSPYSVLSADEIVSCDTDAGNITLLLPEGTDGEPHKITNVGSVNNTVSLTPFGTEDLEGDNATLTIYDTETLDIAYDENTGWWA